MAVGDIYQMTVSWLFSAQVCQNVFHYELISGSEPDHALGLFQAWHNDVRQLIIACMADTCQLDRVDVVNLMNAPEFHVEADIGQDGDLISGTTQTAAGFVSFGFRLEKAYPGAPNGYKRFPGVAEGYTAEDLYVPPGNAIANLAVALEQDINDPAYTDVFHLQVVHRPFSLAVPPTVWWPVTAVTFTNLTSQNSRKD